MIRHADWIVDVGPAAGEHGGEILYSGRPQGSPASRRRRRARYLFAQHAIPRRARRARRRGWLELRGRHAATTSIDLDVAFPLGVLTTVTGVSGSGKSSLVSQALVELVGGAARPTRRRRRRGASICWSGRTRSRPAADRAGLERHRAAGPGRPEADRPHAALEPRDVHRPVRPRPQAVRRDASSRGRAATTPGGSRSTSRRAAARTATARAS